VSLIVVVVFGGGSLARERSVRTPGARADGGPPVGVRRCVESVRKGCCRGSDPYDDRRDGSGDVGCRRDREAPSHLALTNGVEV